jgi:hypothetical protein
MELSDESVDSDRALLMAERRRLLYRLQQRAKLGEYAPPEVAFDIEAAQQAIQGLKERLRANGALVEDQPEDTAQVSVAHPRSAREQRTRQEMIKRMQATWFARRLEQPSVTSFHIIPTLEDRPEKTRRPISDRMQEAHREPQSPRPGIAIVEIFDAAGGELLLLGDAGAGKSTLLLELAQVLLKRAIDDSERSVPVIFPLRSTMCLGRSLWSGSLTI